MLHQLGKAQVDTTAGFWTALVKHAVQLWCLLGEVVRHNSSHVRCKNVFFSSDLYKEQMHSNKFLNESLSAYTIPRQRAPQNHRTGFVICRIVQAQTGSTENDWGYAGGKKQTNTISKGHVLLHYVVPCSAIHSRIILKHFPFLLPNLEDFV